MKPQTLTAVLVSLVLVNSWLPIWQLTLAHQLIFTNLKCTVLNKSCVEIPECRLRAVKRNLNEVTVWAKLLQLPAVNMTVQLQFMKKSNGYITPYGLGKLNIDACKFLATQSNPLVKYLYSFMRPYTNLNHTCPLNHDVILKNFRVDQTLLKRFSIIPSGDYAFFNIWAWNNVKCARTELHFAYRD